MFRFFEEIYLPASVLKKAHKIFSKSDSKFILLLFQPRSTTPRASQSLMMPVSPLISKISKVSTFVDPLIVTLFDLPSISPKMYPTETSWAEKQEEARIGKENY